MSMNSPGPQQSRFHILIWLETLRTMNKWRLESCACSFFVTNPYHMGVCVDSPGHLQLRFDILSYLTWDPQGPGQWGHWGCAPCGGPCIIFNKPLQYGCLRTLLEFQWLRFWQHFEMTRDPQGIGHMALCCFISEKEFGVSFLGIYSLFFKLKMFWICIQYQFIRAKYISWRSSFK